MRFHKWKQRRRPGQFRNAFVFAAFAVASVLLIVITMMNQSIALGSPQSQGEQETIPEHVIRSETITYISFTVSVVVLKITAFVLGYLIVKLGHDTLVKGVSGELDFGFSGSGFSTKLKSASPGAFFVLIGGAIILWGLTVKKPYISEYSRDSRTPAVQQQLAPKPEPSDDLSDEAPELIE